MVMAWPSERAFSGERVQVALQLISLAPVAGIVVLLYLFTYPSKALVPGEATVG